MIGCLVIPDFPVAVEQQLRPDLKHTPLIISQHQRGRGTVHACSADLKACGIQPGMTLRHAQLLCPTASLIPLSLSRCQRSLDNLVHILGDYANRIEPVRISHRQTAGIIYLELGRMRPSDAAFLGQRLLDHLRGRTGFVVSLGMAKSKFTALVAALHPSETGWQIITPDQEADFLAARPISLLPMGKEMARRLHLLGLRSIGQFAALPGAAVFNQFGQHGQRLWRMAQGKDQRPVRPQKPVRHEYAQCQFEPPVSQRQPLEACLKQLALELSQRLCADGLGAQSLSLTLLLDNGQAVEDALPLNQPTSSPERLYWSMAYLLQRMQAACPIVQLDVHLTDLRPPLPRQLSLFDTDTSSQRLEQILIDLIPRHGVEPFYDISLLRPAAMQIQRRFWLEPVDPDRIA